MKKLGKEAQQKEYAAKWTESRAQRQAEEGRLLAEDLGRRAAEYVRMVSEARKEEEELAAKGLQLNMRERAVAKREKRVHEFLRKLEEVTQRLQKSVKRKTAFA